MGIQMSSSFSRTRSARPHRSCAKGRSAGRRLLIGSLAPIAITTSVGDALSRESMHSHTRLDAELTAISARRAEERNDRRVERKKSSARRRYLRRTTFRFQANARVEPGNVAVQKSEFCATRSQRRKGSAKTSMIRAQHLSKNSTLRGQAFKTFSRALATGSDNSSSVNSPSASFIDAKRRCIEFGQRQLGAIVGSERPTACPRAISTPPRLSVSFLCRSGGPTRF